MDWTKWTEADHVSDEMLLDEFAGLTKVAAHVAARSYRLNDYDREDIRSEITLRLLRISQDKRAFDGYCRTVVNNSIRDSINNLMSRGGGPRLKWRDYSTLDFETSSRFQCANYDADLDGSELIDSALPIPESPEDSLVMTITLDSAMAVLSEREREIVSLHYGSDMSLTSVATRMNSDVRHTLNTALDKLRSVLKPA